ncbi:hypothetical protein [Enterococcus sp. HY326]|uniref:hypothetical protein n=1 Tax=Enterococcus sp. HY326 TaxID=2971265 RepID=UPI00224044F3|nr:hypothetical protein [Enterococcus sp. HY326]
MATNFTLTIDGKIYNSDDITSELITSSLVKKETEFVILEPEKPIHDSLYLQYAAAVEIRFLSPAGEMSHYSYIPDSGEEIVPMFLNYFTKNEIPDIQGWQDITSSFRPHLLKRIMNRFKKRENE